MSVGMAHSAAAYLYDFFAEPHSNSDRVQTNAPGLFLHGCCSEQTVTRVHRPRLSPIHVTSLGCPAGVRVGVPRDGGRQVLALPKGGAEGWRVQRFFLPCRWQAGGRRSGGERIESAHGVL